jgi:membrane associated rhomboid family serine protease
MGELKDIHMLVLLIVVATSVFDFSTNFSLRDRFILNPWLVVHRKQYYRVVTSSLVHGDFFHLLFNALAFYNFAPLLEFTLRVRAENSLTGSLHFLYILLVSLVVSTIPSLAKHQNNPSYNALGASGFVSGIVFATICFYPFIRLQVLYMIPMPAWLFAVLYLWYSHWAARKAQDNIGHDAHFWGALAGVGMVAILHPQVPMGIYEYVIRFLTRS